MRILLSLLVQSAAVIFTFGLMGLSVYLLTEASEPKQYISSLRFGAFSDIHADFRYDPETSNDFFCKVNNTAVQNLSALEDFRSSNYAPLGRFFCNPPQALFEMMLKKMKLVKPDLNVLLITGDFIGHFTNNERGEPYDPERYVTLMNVHQNLSSMIQREMRDVLVIPTFGNNDFDLDDEPANDTAKAEFYSRIFKIWFEDHPTNSKLMNLTSIRPTFLDGGYYRVDINPKLSVLALNTVLYLWKNKGMLEQGT